MARLVITGKAAAGSYPATPITANSADLAFTPAGADFADGAGVVMTGNDLLLVHNGNVGVQTVTISSTVDDFNRKGDITAYSLAAGEYAVFGPFERKGWVQADGMLYFAASATDVGLAVIHLP